MHDIHSCSPGQVPAGWEMSSHIIDGDCTPGWDELHQEGLFSEASSKSITVKRKAYLATDKEDSTMTLEEVIFQTMSSFACFSGCFSANDSAQAGVAGQSVSKLLLVGTHRDLVSEEEFRKKDQLLQQRIQNTPFYDKGLVEFASEGQLMLAVDNMNGGEDEIGGIRKFLESVILKSFEKVEISLAWLLLSLTIRAKKKRTMSLVECQKLAAKLGIGPDELQEALHFLHHRIGVLLY